MPTKRQEINAPSHTDVCLYLDYYGELLGARQQAMMELYFNEDLSLAEIAKTTELTRQGVHDQIRRGVKRLSELESVLGLAARDKRLALLLQEAMAQHENNENEQLDITLARLYSMIMPQEADDRTEGMDDDGRI